MSRMLKIHVIGHICVLYTYVHLLCMTPVIHMSGMTHSCTWHEIFARIAPHSMNVCNNSKCVCMCVCNRYVFVCVSITLHRNTLTHISSVWHISFIWETWLIHIHNNLSYMTCHIRAYFPDTYNSCVRQFHKIHTTTPLQHTAAHRNTLQHTATLKSGIGALDIKKLLQHTATHTTCV